MHKLSSAQFHPTWPANVTVLFDIEDRGQVAVAFEVEHSALFLGVDDDLLDQAARDGGGLVPRQVIGIKRLPRAGDLLPVKLDRFGGAVDGERVGLRLPAAAV